MIKEKEKLHRISFFGNLKFTNKKSSGVKLLLCVAVAYSSLMSTLLLIVAASLLLYIAKLASPMVTYFLRKGEYAHIPKYNKKKSKAFMPSMLMSEDDGWYKMVETLRGEDGKILPVVHWGPYLDFSHTIAVADADVCKQPFSITSSYRTTPQHITAHHTTIKI